MREREEVVLITDHFSLFCQAHVVGQNGSRTPYGNGHKAPKVVGPTQPQLYGHQEGFQDVQHHQTQDRSLGTCCSGQRMI